MVLKIQSNVRGLAIAQFRRDWPFMAASLDGMRDKAALRGPACGDTASAAGALPSVHPHGNHGDNLTNLTGKGVL